jgi:beta-glucosidase
MFNISSQLRVAAAAMIASVLSAPAVLANGNKSAAPQVNPWMASDIVMEQRSAQSPDAKEAVANRRARLLIGAMPELPQCYGARHVSGIAALNIPTFRISNGPVGVGQNDCVSPSVLDKSASGIFGASMAAAYTHHTSAKATALPSALGVAASFDPEMARVFGDVIATEMNNLALHVFEAPGINLARLPILGRNFEYFGEDPYLSGVMATAETRAVQDQGIIAMLKHFAANEQETNRMAGLDSAVDRQVLREIYLLPFEMAIKDGDAASVMCAYNYVHGVSACENKELLTDILRRDWGFTGYVQTDFFAMKSTVAPLKAGMDHEMPQPIQWAPAKLEAALAAGEIDVADIDTALVRRYTQAFKAGIFDRPLVQTPIDFAAGGQKAREVGVRSAVLLQNNDVLPFRTDVRSVVIIGKASQVYAQQAVAGGAIPGEPFGSGGGSSDVVPHYSVTPVEGIRNALKASDNAAAEVKLILVDDANETATIDGAATTFAQALAEAGRAEAVVLMAGTISEEGADRATFVSTDGRTLAESPAAGSSLDWYAPRSNVIATAGKDNTVKNSRTLAMIEKILAAPSATGERMADKTALVLKDNAGVAIDPILVGPQAPALLEVWFPGQEDGNIVADVLFGRVNPSGKLPVSFPYVGKGFLDHVTPAQFPGVVPEGSKLQTVSYSEGLAMGYRWYDANVSGECALVRGRNPCVAFPFGHGLSYTTFRMGAPKLAYDSKEDAYRATTTVTNNGNRPGAEVIQAYVSLPPSANAVGVPQPPKRLVGFQRVELAPGESKAVTIKVDPAASNHPLSVWNEREGKWVRPAGEYTLWIGNSSSPADLEKAGTFSF